MKIIVALFFMVLLSSFKLQTTCDTSKLYGEWLLVDSYEEQDVNIDTLLQMKIVSYTKIKVKYLKSGISQNNHGDYTDTEMFTLDGGRCVIQSLGLTSSAYRNFYIQHLDDNYLIGLEKGIIYFYVKLE